TQILETPWFIVVTSLDNTFFYNKETKTSIWIPTPELEIVLAKMGQAETERLKLEAEKAAKEAQEQERKRPLDAREGAADKRAKPDNANTGTEMTEDDVAWQLAQMEGMMGDEDQEMASQDEDEDEESDDEAVQARLRMLQGTNSTPSQPVSRPSAGMELTEENVQEREMAFLDIMRDRGVTPFDTWERALTKIESDPRMYLIPGTKEQQALFESYCVIRAQEIKDAKEKESASKSKDKDSKEDRKSKGSTVSASASSSSSKPEDVYRRLMEDYTTTKSTWLDFMTKYRTDQRFLALKPGSLRESIFRAYLSDLKKGNIQPKDKKSSSSSSSRPSSSSSRHHSSSSSSRKYKATDKEIEEFSSLLKETKKDILYEHKHSSSVEWRKIKKLIDRDRRYDAVGSSTERELLFREYADRVIQKKD
ncbi:transcription elongation regulator, partial [Haplosporangium bisporale]